MPSSSMQRQLSWAAVGVLLVGVLLGLGASAASEGSLSPWPATALVEVAAGKANTGPPRRIKGKIKLNGEFYATDCHCEDPDATSKCKRPERIRVHKEDHNKELHLTKADLKALLGDPRDMDMLAARRASLADVDPRDTRKALRTPGGDFGEYLMAYSTYETATNAEATYEEVLERTRQWLRDLTQPMYVNTDEAAVHNLASHLHVGGVQGTVVGLNIKSPPEALREEALSSLPRPENQGSYALKSLLEAPKLYYVRPDLAAHVIRAVYATLWDTESKDDDGILLSKKINLQVFEGDVSAKAWVNVRSDPACEEEQRFPGMATAIRQDDGKDMQLYVNHPAAAAPLRRRLAKFFTSDNDIKVAEFSALLNRRARQWTELTAERLGSAVPFYTVIPS